MSLNRLTIWPLGCLRASCALAASPTRADPVSAVQLLRTSGCAGTLPASDSLQHNRRLDRAAALGAAGESPLKAAGRSGYMAERAVGLRLSGPDDSIMQALRRTRCRPI